MKKIIMGLLLLLSIFNIEKVHAQTYQLDRESIYDVYYVRSGGDVPAKEGIFNVFRFNGEIAYCIEPGKTITTNNYKVENGYINIPYSDDIKDKLELVGYYGSEYPGHDGIRYIMATQALIWELTGSGDVTFYTGEDKTTVIDISKERNEILFLVNNHSKLPTIASGIKGEYYDKLVFQDELLNDYEITNYGSNTTQEITLNGNTLTVRSKNIGDSTIELTKKKYDNKETLIFVGTNTTNTQKLGRFRFTKDVKFNINIHINGIKLKINKFDNDFHLIEKAGIKFKVKDLSTNEYLCPNNECTYETLSNGFVVVDNLNYGEYEVEEVENQIIDGYTWNKEKYRVSIPKEKNFNYQLGFGYYVYLNFINNKVTGKLEITKKGEIPVFSNNEITYKKNNLSGVEFLLYNSNDELITTLVTNQDGYAKYNDLEVGKYYLMEKNISSKYQENNEKYSFEIKQNNQYDEVVTISLEIPNYLKKGTIEFTKLDDETKVGIPNTIMEIYDINNNLLFTKETDSGGKIIIKDLPMGEYYLIEKEANESYQLASEKINFEIKDSDITKINMENQKLVGSLELTKYGEKESIKNNSISYEKIKLSNITFELYDEKDNLIDTITTDNNGYLKYDNLPLGKYYVKEKSILDNYIFSNKKYYFEIKKDNDKVVNAILEINNYLKKGTIEFTKLDNETKVGIPNTIMEIYDINNNLLFTKETDINGKIIIKDLPIGEYYLIEKEANYFYHKENMKITFVIKEDKEMVKPKMYNQKLIGSLELTKYGEKESIENNNISYKKTKLSNITFELYDEKDNLIDTITTDNNGYLKYDNLPLGKYYVKEKSILDNYVFNNEKHYFEIKKDNDKVVNAILEINNYLKKGTLEFTKLDNETKVGISNTIMEIYDINNNLLFTKETDSDGKIIIKDLPIGEYYLIEKEANDNYQLTNEKIIFEIKGDEVTKTTMTNEMKEILVPKTGINDTLIVNKLFQLFMVFVGTFYGKKKKY